MLAVRAAGYRRFDRGVKKRKLGQMSEDDDEVQVVKPPSTLKAKVGTGGPGAVDLETLEKAEAVIASLSDSYLEWVEEDLKKLEAAMAKLKAEQDKGREHLDKIFQISHDIKGQGGSFGYQMMTIIGNQLCRLVEQMDEAGPSEIKVIDLHIDALKMVIAKRMDRCGDCCRPRPGPRTCRGVATPGWSCGCR